MPLHVIVIRRLAIHFSSMADLIDRHLARSVVDEIHDAIVALTNAIPILVASELLRPTRPGIAGQGHDFGHDARSVRLGANRSELLTSGGLDR